MSPHSVCVQIKVRPPPSPVNRAHLGMQINGWSSAFSPLQPVLLCSEQPPQPFMVVLGSGLSTMRVTPPLHCIVPRA